MRAASERPLHRGGDAALRAWLTLRALALRLDDLPAAWVVAPLVVVQWAVVLAVAMRAGHNGWLYYSGGDAVEYWTEQWGLSRLLVPYSVLGYAVPTAFAWVPAVLGINALVGLPALVLAQVLLLTPVTAICVHAIARRLAGSVFAAFATLVWVLTPLASVPLWRPDYHDRYVDHFLPQLYGLVNLGDFPSLVVLLVAGWLIVRTIDDGRGNDALLAGLVLGLAIGVKPANAIVLPAVVLALAAARRWRSLVLSLVALAPAIVTLAVWKQRGLGQMPLLSLPEVREAAGGFVAPLGGIGNYTDISWSQLHYNLGQLREFFWSRLLCEFLVVAGAFALLRKSVPKGLYVVLWFAAFYLVKGAGAPADLRNGSYLRLTMPGLPAFLLLAAAVALLVPGWGRRHPVRRRPETWPRPAWSLAVVAGLVALLPLVVAGVARPAPRETYARVPGTTIDTPVDRRPTLRLSRIADGVRLEWPPARTRGSRVFYLVFRSRGRADTCTYTGTVGNLCILEMDYLGRTAITRFEDTPLPGHYQYRVMLAASFRPLDADLGDALLTSLPAGFDVRCATARCRRDVARLRGR